MGDAFFYFQVTIVISNEVRRTLIFVVPTACRSVLLLWKIVMFQRNILSA